jgi:hypothetical protein
MHIERFSDDHPDHLEVIVRDGERLAHVVMEKRSNRVIEAEAVGCPDAAGDHSFAEEASVWIAERVRPKYLRPVSTAA